jgi:hypothetical protein
MVGGNYGAKPKELNAEEIILNDSSEDIACNTDASRRVYRDDKILHGNEKSSKSLAILLHNDDHEDGSRYDEVNVMDKVENVDIKQEERNSFVMAIEIDKDIKHETSHWYEVELNIMDTLKEEDLEHDDVNNYDAEVNITNTKKDMIIQEVEGNSYYGEIDNNSVDDGDIEDESRNRYNIEGNIIYNMEDGEIEKDNYNLTTNAINAFDYNTNEVRESDSAHETAIVAEEELESNLYCANCKRWNTLHLNEHPSY